MSVLQTIKAGPPGEHLAQFPEPGYEPDWSAEKSYNGIPNLEEDSYALQGAEQTLLESSCY